MEEIGSRTWMRMVPGPREKEEKVARGQYRAWGKRQVGGKWLQYSLSPNIPRHLSARWILTMS